MILENIKCTDNVIKIEILITMVYKPSVPSCTSLTTGTAATQVLGSVVNKSINRATNSMIFVHTLCIYTDTPKVCLEQVPISCHAFCCV